VKIIRARTAGFCMGVSLALNRLEKTLASLPGIAAGGGRLITLGPIIHNPRVMEDYAEQGVLCLEDPDAIRPGDHVLIRAHGISREVEERLLDSGAVVLDATCPRVKAAQLAIRAEADRGGGTLLLFGEADHPEVRGLVSYAGGNALVFADVQEINALGLDPRGAYYLAAQTTQDTEGFAAARERLAALLARPFPVLKTICGATRRRQDEAVAIAHKADIMVVVGGLNSGNTRRLADVARGQGIPVVHVECPADLPLGDGSPFAGKGAVGLTAGASTPAAHIEAVYAVLQVYAERR
jgi:4-hydroxy-3-methylbut-2-enyl diphosphate reductase